MSQVITSHRSPNFNERGPGMLITCVVMHATEDEGTIDGPLSWLCRPHGNSSAHVLIDRDGTVYDLIDVKHRAWHAGPSALNGQTDGEGSVNGFSIGVELANRGNGEAYSDAQLGAAACLVAGYLREWPGILIENVVRHKDVALPPGRKADPQPPFDLDAFRALVAEELQR